MLHLLKQAQRMWGQSGVGYNRLEQNKCKLLADTDEGVNVL